MGRMNPPEVVTDWREATLSPREVRALELRQMAYPEYLETPEWQARRNAQVWIDGGRCRVCNSAHLLDVHHRTYERRRGCEEPGDLITLCRDCHGLFHEYRHLSQAAAA